MSLSAAEVQARDGLHDWRVVARRLHGTFRTGTMVRGIELVRRIGDLAEELDHHPDMDVRYFRVHVVLTTHDAGGLTENDVTLARRISALAAELGIEAEPARAQRVELTVDARDVAAVAPFWRAVLGYRTPAGEPPGPAGTLVLADPAGRGPTVHLQRAAAPARVRLDVHLPHDEAPARVRAALDAGGQLVADDAAPAQWILADAEGNAVRLRTWQPPEPPVHDAVP
ncbi:4a-hydroxytetrahydrobiopterin dehydratase [Georgenia sp. AZ-5]|uniref:4a-hydroxytetrahydrobiopterin dehydratase n=1 Tax=Georgenia sp. AZ-5 TaxID=3367526 RepID=UPI00375440FD